MVASFAIIGRPNVGKSTLFNRLTRSRQALVLDQPGVTRDRLYGEGSWQGNAFIAIDTGGIAASTLPLDQAILAQTDQAMLSADAIFFVVDARVGISSLDLDIAKQLRKQAKPVVLVVNKMDGLKTEIDCAEFYQLGFKTLCPIAASQNQGMDDLLRQAFKLIPTREPEAPTLQGPKVAIVGRPNVGKSTLLNRMLGEERSIVADVSGTTRDSIYAYVERQGQPFTLIDTAGVRKKNKTHETIEKFSVIKTLQAIKDAHVVLLVFDARCGLTDQDLSLIDFAVREGRSLIVCANKWDGMQNDDRKQIKEQLAYRLKFADFALVYYISALHGTGVGDLFQAVKRAYTSARKELSSVQLTAILQDALKNHPTPLIHGRRIKLRYAHCGGHNPPTIVIHGNQTDILPQSYQRYLSNYFVKALKLVATPVRVIFKTGENPFAGKRNVLSKRQFQKRRRLMRHVKKG